MKYEKLKGEDNRCKVTVRFDGISLKGAARLSKEFRRTHSFITQNTHNDALSYTDIFFWISSPPDDWEEVFKNSLKSKAEEEGWTATEDCDGLTIIK